MIVAESSSETSLAPGGCAWCRRPIEATRRPRATYCGRKCRQAAWRLRRLAVAEVLNDRPRRFAYADPPYPGLARKYYRHEASFAGEVDHAKLVASLKYSYDGWALSTSAKALRDVLPLCPPTARVCAWVKPIGASSRTFGLHNCWEPLIVVPGRRRRGGQRDWLSAQPARHGGTLPGRKPIAFAAWLFACLGMQPGDELVDLFPGTGVIGRAWAELSRAPGHDPSSGDGADVAGVLERRSTTPRGDGSPAPASDGSAGAGATEAA